MKAAAWVILCAMVVSIPAGASTAVAIRAPHTVVIATDSYFAEEVPGRPLAVTSQCKIWRTGPVFFAGAGILYYGKFSVRDLAVESLQNAASLEEGLAKFTAEMAPALATTMSALRKEGLPAYRERIGKSVTELVFATLTDGVPTLHIRYFLSSLDDDGSIKITAVDEKCPSEKCTGGTQFVAMGEHDAIDRHNAASKSPWDGNRLPALMRDFVQLQIDEESLRAAEAKMRGESYQIHVAAPISVLEISPSGAHWANIDGVAMSGRCASLPQNH